MKNSALQGLFLTNYILFLLYTSWHIGGGEAGIENRIPLLISSLMLVDMTYISACNIRENKIISLFCGLLALDSWYVLLSFEKAMAESFVFNALSPVICFVSIKFILLFLFQGSGYKFQRAVNVILLITSMGSLAGIGISGRVYAGLYGIQFLANGLCLLFILIYHRKRTAFVLKSEWKCISFSAMVIIILFAVYYFATIGLKDHISNFGIYLPVLLFFMSVHGIVHKEHSGCPLSTVFNRKQTALILCAALFTLGLVILAVGGSYEKLIIAVNILFAFVYICNIILGQSLKRGESKIMKESKYNAALRQLQQEELLKAEFANFLHDDVLQDLLSVKNMMTKAHRPDIQDIIIETLDNLNNHIREQMQNYHPVMRKNLTVKENCQNLIEAVSQSFSQRNMKVSFECSDTIFLVEPYNILVYRLLKELFTNVYKHSDGSRVWITLTQENGMIDLNFSDDGTANAASLISADKTKHKGIASIAEQIENLEGKMAVSDGTPHGVCIHIQIPMKGDVSYQYFVS